MTASSPLTGIELVDCARANATEGLEAAAQRCGYGEDLSNFERKLQEAGVAIGVAINSLNDLITTPQTPDLGIEIAPDSPDQL
ncbi:MAG: hypothetical protein KME16_12815 [Scytolyngbya sp. HA4215-MV1]|jgi:hypothetical protein|nr:hypothetical protein [Scytolyngbya sp. HA4215-MV1]